MPLLAASLAMMTFDGRDVTVTVDGRLLDVIVPKFTRSQSRTLLSPQRYTRMTIKQARMPFDLFEERGRVESTVTK